MISKKGQVEIVGMLIVVILVVFVIFFIIRIRAATQPPEIHKTYMNDQMSTSFILAFLDTGSECVNHATFRDLIADCASGQEKLSCGGPSSCEYIDQKIEDVLNDTLDLWGIKYRFNISHNGFLGGDLYYKTCDPAADVQRRAFQSIPMWPNPTSVHVNMDICIY